MSRKTQNWRFWCSSFIVGSVLINFLQERVLAQVRADDTLPNNSVVTRDGDTFNINGGTQSGSNLFHSFEEFSIPDNGTASFNNSVNIQNIIGRVTGGKASDINGLIEGNGSANLFLINPWGIIFGKNARLDIGGSFVGSTADAIGFGKDNFFSASNPEKSSSLLEVAPDALFFNQIKAASIQNNSVVDLGLRRSGNTVRGLRVPDGKSLLLLGGNINIDHGGLYAFGGRVELGGLNGKGTIGLNRNGNNLSLSFPDGVERSDVSLSNSAVVNVTAGDGGSIAINARNLEMTARSSLLAGIESGLGSEQSRAGNIDVNATVAINLKDDSLIANTVPEKANGQGGDINISTSALEVEDGATVITITLTEPQPNLTGYPNNITVTNNTFLFKDGAQVGADTFAEENAGFSKVELPWQLFSESADGELLSGLLTSTQPKSIGHAGDLTIKTNTLLVKDGGQVGSATLGEGKGGNLTINAQDVQLIGTKNGQLPSAFFASTQPNSTGDSGDLTIKTNTLLVKDGGQVGTGTFGKGNAGSLTLDAQDVQLIGKSANGQLLSILFTSAQPKSRGDAGDLKIKTNTLLVKDGGQVGTGTFGEGNAGNLSVNAEDVQLIGGSVNDQFGTGLGSTAGTNSTGDAGDLKIKTNTLLVKDGALVSVQSRGTGSAGEMTLNARFIRLNNEALVTADTQSNRVDPREQATININSQDLIMTRNSNIFTNAKGEEVIGGNINIDTDLLIGFENSDISANSENFFGGRVRIDTQGILGIQARDVASDNTSDITATGANPDFSGTVELDAPEIDPNSGLVELPTVPVDTEVAQGCYSPGYAQSSFVITGRGGLPPNPKDILTPDATQIDWVSVKPSNNNRSLPPVITKASTERRKPIVEATGAILNDKGQIVLTANPSRVTSGIPKQNLVSCNGR